MMTSCGIAKNLDIRCLRTAEGVVILLISVHGVKYRDVSTWSCFFNYLKSFSWPEWKYKRLFIKCSSFKCPHFVCQLFTVLKLCEVPMTPHRLEKCTYKSKLCEILDGFWNHVVPLYFHGVLHFGIIQWYVHNVGFIRSSACWSIDV